MLGILKPIDLSNVESVILINNLILNVLLDK